MLHPLTVFAESAPADENLLVSLGIDWTMLLIQAAAFLLLVAVLAKYVYPIFLRVLDQRDEAARESANAAEAAKAHAEKAEAEVEKLLTKARKDARDIVATAKDEATATVEMAENRAKVRADKLVADAKEQLDKDVLAARKTLHNDTLELVAQATEQVVGKTVNAKVDESVIKASLTEVR